MENKNQNKKPFDIMDYFSVMRIAAALLLSILLVFVIIFFVSQTPAPRELMTFVERLPMSFHSLEL